QVFARRPLRELREIVAQLAAGVAPGEVRVRLREAELRQIFQTLGTRECFGEKDDVRVSRVNLADYPFPEGEGFGVRIVHAERVHAMSDPEEQDVETGLPERVAILAPEVERINVLVFLGRILRVLDGAVGANEEPFGMFAQQWMIGRTLQGIVQRDLESQLAGLLHEAVEVLERAESRLDGRVSAGLAADGPGTAGIVRRRGQGVVASLATGLSHRVNGREIDDVEAQTGDAAQRRTEVGEGGVFA